MASMAETNPYLRDPERRQRMLEENARQSSFYEGARGLKMPSHSSSPERRAAIASRKKAVKGE